MTGAFQSVYCHRDQSISLWWSVLSSLKIFSPGDVLILLGESWYGSLFGFKGLFRATRGAHNPNLQVVITNASHVRSQHSFGLPLRMNGMHRMQFDYMRLDLLSLEIWSHKFDHARFEYQIFRYSDIQIFMWNLCKAQLWSKKCFALWSLSFALRNLWLLLVYKELKIMRLEPLLNSQLPNIARCD